MDLLAGKKLIRKSGNEVSADEALKDKIIGFYFSAHWCPPCRMFTPVLADFYNDLVDQGAPFEIVFVSSDRTAEDMKSYMTESHADWLAIPHGDPLVGVFNDKFNVEGIPTLVVLKCNGDVISLDAVEEVQESGPVCFVEWRDKK